MNSKARNMALSAGYWVFVIYLFIPILVMVAVSFRDSRFVGFPIGESTQAEQRQQEGLPTAFAAQQAP